MTYIKGQPVITADEVADKIDIDTSNLQDKTSCILNVEYNDTYLYKVVCVDRYDWSTDKFIVRVCNHIGCPRLLGIISEYNSEEKMVLLNANMAWVVWNEPFKVGDRLISSGIPGVFKKSVVGSYRVLVDLDKEDNVVHEEFIGYNENGEMTFKPVVDESGEVEVSNYPQVLYVRSCGTLVSKMEYHASKTVPKVDVKKVAKVEVRKSRTAVVNKETETLYRICLIPVQ